MRDHDVEAAERFVAAMRAMDDNELLAVVQPLVDVQGMVIEGRLRARPRNPKNSLATLIGNERAVEFLEAIGNWVFAELKHRDEILEGLEESK